MAEGLNSLVDQTIDHFSHQLGEISGEIWHNPELAFKEVQAHQLLTGFLREQGFNVTEEYLDVKTAFRASYCREEDNGAVVSVLCEYDALPEIGHACGHNLIAVTGLAAGLALKAALQTGKIQGKVIVLGTPAEEAGGGKVMLIRRGAFRGVDVALIAHPAPATKLFCDCMAVVEMKVTYHGRASHAAAFPWEGINALDAAVACYVNLSMIRQQCKPEWRVHAVISNGGERPNIIPEITQIDIYYRAPSKSETEKLGKMVRACIDSAAQSSGCTVKAVEGHNYSPMTTNMTLHKQLEKHCLSLNILGAPQPAEYTMSRGSTDMGNVSEVVPSVHPFFDIYPKNDVGPHPVNHTRGFTAAANTPVALQASLNMANALARTAIDVLTDKKLLKSVRDEFKTAAANHFEPN